MSFLRSGWRVRSEIARPGEVADVEAERIFAQRVGIARRVDRDAENGGPVRGGDEIAALIGALRPFHLKGVAASPDHTGHIHSDGPVSDLSEGIAATCELIQEP